jgi:NAD(P)H-quinone oxidoreductase subunit 4
MELLPHSHYRFSLGNATSTSLGLKKEKPLPHMGFIILGICSITDIGLNGAMLEIFSHGARLIFLACDRMCLVYQEKQLAHHIQDER